MRYSICIPCFFGDMDFCDALRRIRSLGFDAAETWNWPGLDLDRVHATCEKKDISLVGFCTTDFRLTDPARRDGWLHALEASARAAVRAGATNYAAVFRAIDEAGYAGCFGLEYFPLGDPEESLRGFRRLYLGKDAESTSRDPAS